tara:strand:- start:88 stop:684 length:597 start_codon:yes stop_codon:yes gene_type:complete
MARLTKEERKVFDPTFLIESQKREAKIIRDLMIGKEKKEPGKEEGGHSPYQPWKPAPGGPYVPAPGKETANWVLPSGSGRGLPEELYWDGLKTILESTEANSDEQNMRLNILWHQFHDQVQGPKDGLKIAHGDGGGWEHLDKTAKDRIRRPEFEADVIKGLEEGTILPGDAAEILRIPEEELPNIINKFQTNNLKIKK